MAGRLVQVGVDADHELETRECALEALATGNLGNVFFALGRYAEAQEHFERQRALSREIGDRRGEAITAGNLGLVFHALGRYAEAQEHHERHRALTYRLVEWTGRWGMLDVLLVAILLAVLKLGDMVEVSVGPGLLAFTSCVGLSLIAAASFDPHSLWEPQP